MPAEQAAAVVKAFAYLEEGAAYETFELFVLRLDALLDEPSRLSSSSSPLSSPGASPKSRLKKAAGKARRSSRSVVTMNWDALSRLSGRERALAMAIVTRFRKILTIRDRFRTTLLAHNLTQLLVAWVEHSPRHRLTGFIKSILPQWEQEFPEEAARLKLALLRRAPPPCLRAARLQAKLKDKKSRKRTASSMIRGLMASEHRLFGTEVRVIAEHLTLKESGEFSKIHISELCGQAWQKPGKEDVASHVVFLVERFNKMSHWVTRSVCEEPEVANRAELIGAFIMLASSLREVNNFNACMAVLGGLNNVSVQRLKKSWKATNEKQQEKWSELSLLLDTKNNYSQYRSVVAAATPPVIPFLGVYLRDLTFIEDGNQDKMKSGLVNVEKLLLFGTVIANVRRYQRDKFIPTTDRFLPTLLLTIEHQWLIPVPENADDELYALSTSHEPIEG
mmetsp:Transcript_9047/g.37312  ORF Transcript_9047/g.37312 Transcript_9047/m.37312 type:complete len:449 (-) Transcript_9047:55-1401(-)